MFVHRFLGINELTFLGCNEAEVIVLCCLKISWNDPSVCICIDCLPWVNMPVSTGFPLSAVCKNHARKALNATRSSTLSHPDMSPSTNCFSMADGQNLPINKRVAVPLTFANGRTISFEMFVLDDLSHNIVFGQNHLEKLDAAINFSSGEITFCDPDFNPFNTGLFGPL